MKAKCGGFTLVEIMIVVAIIGLLAAIALPSMQASRERSQITAVANDFRKFSDALNIYAFNNKGTFPPSDWTEGAYPTGMEGEMPDAWIEETPVGGYYVFHDPPGDEHLVLLNRADLPTAIMEGVDEILDDGDLGTGRVRGDAGSLDFYIH